jgi:hypothetical protein
MDFEELGLVLENLGRGEERRLRWNQSGEQS